MIICPPSRPRKKSTMSFIKMPSAELGKLAQECLDRIAARRENKFVQFAEREVERHTKSWWRRLWGSLVITLAEARAELEHDMEIFSTAQFIRAECGGQELIAHRLLRASQFASVVNVSVDDLDRIT